MGTTTIFNYSPTKEEVKRLYALKNNISVLKMKDIELDGDVYDDYKMRLIKAEEKMLFKNRNTIGDASETAMVKFAQPINDIESFRKVNPVHTYTSANGTTVNCQIPFNSKWKFNLMIRDMEQSNPNGELRLFLKGAAEVVIQKCDKALINGNEVRIDEDMRRSLMGANDKFASLGERVLAFAKYDLDPNEYPKSSYKFNIKDWMNFEDKQARGEKVEGHFPLKNLTFLGLVSLRDPPRKGVAQSVNQCVSAGVKVIMVTGD